VAKVSQYIEERTCECYFGQFEWISTIHAGEQFLPVHLHELLAYLETAEYLRLWVSAGGTVGAPSDAVD